MDKTRWEILKEVWKSLGLSRLFGSAKFWSLLFAALATSGLGISDEWRAFVILVAAVVFAGTTAWEDAARKRAGG